MYYCTSYFILISRATEIYILGLACV